MSKTREPEAKDEKKKFVVQPDSLKHKRKTIFVLPKNRRD